MASNFLNRKQGTATHRLKQDYVRLMKDPVPYIKAHPLPSNILEWHYAVNGPENTPYEGGIYHGKLSFPFQYPFQAPSIYMITPNGRFKTNSRLCLSISNFHPEKWNPTWSVSTILTGLLSFMLEDTPTLGSLNTSNKEKKAFAKLSWQFNLKDETFCELFPELVEVMKQRIAGQEELNAQAAEQDAKKLSKGGSKNDKDTSNSFIGSFCINLLTVIGLAGLIGFFSYIVNATRY